MEVIKDPEYSALSAKAGAGSLNLSADIAGLPVHRGAKPGSFTTPHFAEKK
ncbi:hypothetical protein [Winslowiella iniecta]|uniref:hypothetical protein n=1 Tax=Winslowiella iniecta TaxID=1560201 RepID=UPI0012E26D24|nr:hypothetical protein [Winslowiella iniecta]